MGKALILGPGGLSGAYGAGVAATLERELGHTYFDTVYACSAGAYTGSYFVSGQPDTIERIWRECLHGDLLMRWQQAFKKDKSVLDLFYLNNVLRSIPYQLRVKDVIGSPTELIIVVTDCDTGRPQYLTPSAEDGFFFQVRASAAVPYLHPEVEIGGKKHSDGGLSDPLPIERALLDGHDEIVIVWNKPQLDFTNKEIILCALTATSYRGGFKTWRRLSKFRHVTNLIRRSKAKIHIISPTADMVSGWSFNSSKDRINTLVDLGIQDALTFLS